MQVCKIKELELTCVSGLGNREGGNAINLEKEQTSHK